MDNRCTLAVVSVFILLRIVDSEVHLSDRLPRTCYAFKGHVNIGVFYSVTSQLSAKMLCDDVMNDKSLAVIVSSVMYAVQVINNRSDILPNITLGFIILDDCASPMAALARGLQVSPDAPGYEDLYPVGETHDCSDAGARYRVDATTGPGSSSRALAVSSILSFYQIPQLSTFATSDELSDKERFEFFTRLVPPDRYQATALVDFITEMGWEYFMLIYSEGSYGENGAKYVEKYAKSLDLCLAWSYRMPTIQTTADDKSILTQLRKYKTARAVILFAVPATVHRLFYLITGTALERNFIWIASDYFTFSTFDMAGDGTFALHFRYKPIPEKFVNYLQSMEVMKDSNFVWFQDLLMRQFNCTWAENDKFKSCQEISHLLIPSVISNSVVYYLNSVGTLAQAMHDVLVQNCPEVFQNISLLNYCLNGTRILEALRTGTFQGVDEIIKFDDSGDRIGGYSIKQYQARNATYGEIVAEWDLDYGVKILWDNLNWLPFNNNVFINVTSKSKNWVLESVCSHPCGYREYYQQKELRCCWQCIRCQSNQRLTENRSSCEDCPVNLWPDTEIRCHPIPPTYIRLTETTGIAIAVVAAFCILVTIAVAVMYSYHRNNRLIKATSREMSALELLGVLLAFLTVFAILYKPTLVSCNISCYGFAMSVCLIYAPLFVKTTRIYRIFAAGRRGLQKPSFIGMKSQVVFCIILVVIQVTIFGRLKRYSFFSIICLQEK